MAPPMGGCHVFQPIDEDGKVRWAQMVRLRILRKQNPQQNPSITTHIIKTRLLLFMKDDVRDAEYETIMFIMQLRPSLRATNSSK